MKKRVKVYKAEDGQGAYRSNLSKFLQKAQMGGQPSMEQMSYPGDQQPQEMDEIQINLAGYTYQQDRATHLSSAVSTLTSSSTSPTVLYLGSTENLGKGVVEIDEELLWVDSFDRVANTATVAPYGRGYLGTTAATHALDTKVTISPTFPRFVIKRAVNDTIRAMGATIFAVADTSLLVTV